MAGVLRRAGPIGLLLMLLAGPGEVLPQAPVDASAPIKFPGESPATARRLAEAHKRIEQRQWSEAVEEYQRILEEAGDHLVPLDPQKPLLCVQARRLCHLALTSLPPEALKLYRRRADEQAKKWLDQGSAERDPALLRRLVDRAFCSRHTDRALDLLGDLALERGDFEEAEQWWRMLARPVSQSKEKPASLTLLFPDPQIDVAQVQAKQVLARLLRGERSGAIEELKAFRAAHGKAEGQLAGRKGNYAALLEKLAEDTAVPDPADEHGWPTFAGDVARTYDCPQTPRCPWLAPTWRIRLDGSDPAVAEPGTPLTPSQSARALAFFPVVAGNLALVCDARAVTAYDLDTGRRLGRCDLVDDLKMDGLDVKLPVKSDVRYTLTVSGDRVYARLGGAALSRLRNGKGEILRPAESYLVCLALPPTPEGKLTPLWQVRARTDTDAAIFEGAPIVQGNQVFGARTRITEDGRALTAVECRDPQTGAVRWQRDVCEGREPSDLVSRQRHHLLTLAGPMLIYCSHSGAVVAVDAATGKQVWAARYPRRGLKTAEGEPSPRDLAPCVMASGRVFAAPADADRIFCFDAVTGQPLWESKPREVVQLLGVAQGRLIFTSAGKQGLRALDAATGDDVRSWIVSDVPTQGRGLLAGDLVFWPTIGGLCALSQEDGSVSGRLPHNQIKGNLALGSGCLVVATDRELIGYVPEARLLPQRRKDAAARPRDPEAQFRFGLALADAGQLEEALQQLQRVERRTVDIGSQVARERHALLLSLAEQHTRAADWDQAAARLNEAAAESFPAGLRLSALVRLAELWEKAGQPAKAVAAWQMILADSSLREGSISGLAELSHHPQHSLAVVDWLPQLAAVHAAARVDSLIRKHGPAVYAPYEATAKELLGALAKDQKKSASLYLRLLEEYPNSATALAVLLRKVELPEALKAMARSPTMDRHVLRHTANDDARAAALVRLARHYQGAHHWEAAVETWKRLAAEHSDLETEAIRFGKFCEELRQKDQGSVSAGPPELGLPLTRSWHAAFTLKAPTGEGTERLLPAAGQGMVSNQPQAFLARTDGSLICRNAITGKVEWETDLGHDRTWVGRQADLVIAGGPNGVQALQIVEGAGARRLWEFAAETASDADRLGSFQLSATRLFLMQGGRRLWALDVETGQVLWSRWAPAGQLLLPPPAGRFDPHYHAGPELLVVRTTSGQRWVLGARTGQTVAEGGGQVEPWPQPPLPLERARVCLIPDARHLVLFQPQDGREIWRQAIERPPSLTGAPPQLAGSGDTLLMLVARSYGHELVSISSTTGLPRWTRYLGAAREPPDLAAAAWDVKAIYLPVDSVLRAFALADGAPLWQTPLGSRPARWRTTVTRKGLLIYAAEAQPEAEIVVFFRRYLPANSTALLPTTGLLPVSLALPGVLTALRREEEPSRILLIVCDPADGRLVQRLNFASLGSRADVTLFEHSGIVVGRQAAWGIK